MSYAFLVPSPVAAESITSATGFITFPTGFCRLSMICVSGVRVPYLRSRASCVEESIFSTMFSGSPRSMTHFRHILAKVEGVSIV